MSLNPLIFVDSKVKGDPLGFVDETKKIFRVMYVTNALGLELFA